MISVDTKKEELIGNYKNGGSDYRPKGSLANASARVWPPPFMQEESSIEPIDMVWC